MKSERILTSQEGSRYGLGDWHTHLPVLVAALSHIRPTSILELGAGDYSTALIHAYVSGDKSRKALTLENDFHPGWFEGLAWMRNAQHKIEKVSDWDYESLGTAWDLVFIDHGPESERIPALEYYSAHGCTVILHDCNYPDRYEELWKRYDYVLHDRTHRFWTMLASNIYDVTGLL